MASLGAAASSLMTAYPPPTVECKHQARGGSVYLIHACTKSDSIDKSDWLVTEETLPTAGFRDPRDPVCRESPHVCGAGLEPFDNGVAFPPLSTRPPSAEWTVVPLWQSHFADGDVKALSAIPRTHSGNSSY